MKKKVDNLGLISTVIICLVALLSAPAHAVSFKISGQINRAVMYADNGVDSEVFHVDNDNSSTRFRFVGSEEIGNGMTAGIVWETQFESNTSSGVDIGQNSDGTSAFTERKLEAFFSGGWGKVWIGQGDGAANGTSEVDLSGTNVITYAGVVDMNGGINFVNSVGTKIITIASTRNQFDGLSRNDRLQYDTPKIGPLTLSASATNGDAWELAARLSTELGGLGKIAAAIGYVDTESRTIPQYDQLGASISWLHGTGVNLTLSYGTRDTVGSTEDPENYYAKLGFKQGKHAVSVEWGRTDDLAAVGDESSSYGGAYVFNAYKGVELYAAYRLYELDRLGVTNLEDINVLVVGTRVKFF